MTAKDITDAHIALQLFPGYRDADTKIFQEFANSEAKPEAGFITDFLGSRIRSTSVWNAARAYDGQLTKVPVPADFHAEAIEWIGLLKAVRDARDEYVAMELGAGFGPWIVAGGTAARRRDIKSIRLYAVEGDPHHFRFLRQHFADNGFDPDRHVLVEAAVGASEGLAEWPVSEEASASEEWGTRPLYSQGDYRGFQFNNKQQVRIIPMRDLVMKEPRWDLIHIDIQGEEVEVCRSCMDDLTSRVQRIIAATHSRKIDGDFIEMMYRAGWALEHEKPARFVFTPSAPTLEAMTTIDGTQVWRNPRFVQVGDELTSFSQEIRTLAHELEADRDGNYVIEITVKNTGTETWIGQTATNPIRAGYRWAEGGSGRILAIEGNRALLSRPSVLPGETDTLKLHVLTPHEPGSYSLLISMVQEGVAWFYDRGSPPCAIHVTVK